MQTDRITLQDLSFFGPEGGVFRLIDRTVSAAGRDTLRRLVEAPPASLERLRRLQETVSWWAAHPQFWSAKISNGTVVMMERFFEAADTVSLPPVGILGAITKPLQKIFNRNEFAFVEFSVTQLADFYGGLLELAALAGSEKALPAGLSQTLEEIAGLLNNELIAQIAGTTEATPYTERARLTFRARRDLKVTTQALLHHFAYLDAWRSLALATTEHGWVFPALIEGDSPVLEAEGLYHPLLRKPVPYALTLDQQRSFLLLTGANMSGKTTLLRSLGIGALLAHLGCGVPAVAMRISFLEGIVTNMHVEDNLLKGESYFFAEVQRMKNTALRLQDDAPHLVLMDELFKGTNVHDAYECTRAIVERLAGRVGQLMVLSTHLHEVATHFERHPALQFARFVTESAPDGSFAFTYKLLPGVSSDRIGFRILQREGVLKLLEGN